MRTPVPVSAAAAAPTYEMHNVDLLSLLVVVVVVVVSVDARKETKVRADINSAKETSTPGLSERAQLCLCLLCLKSCWCHHRGTSI
jgi:hypothetical protein